MNCTSRDHELPKEPTDCQCCCGEPSAYTIQIGDEPPRFYVNTALLENLAKTHGPLLRPLPQRPG